MIKIVIIGVVIAILVKTGSIGKAFGFLFKYTLYPVLCTIGGGIVATFFGATPIGILVGLVIGIILVFKDASNKLK